MRLHLLPAGSATGAWPIESHRRPVFLGLQIPVCPFIYATIPVMPATMSCDMTKIMVVFS